MMLTAVKIVIHLFMFNFENILSTSIGRIKTIVIGFH